MTPIYRAKKIDSNEWVEGYYVPDSDGRGKSTHYLIPSYIHIYDACEYEIDLSTLSIHFSNMVSVNGKKIFASLDDKNGIGGDICKSIYKETFVAIWQSFPVFRMEYKPIDKSEIWKEFNELASDEVEVIGVHTVIEEEVATSAINDNVVLGMITNDLVEHGGYEMLDAEAWAKEHGGCVVSDMWDAYTKYIEDKAEYLGEDDE